MYILSIETATSVCSVAVSEDEKIIYEKVHTEGPSHASLLGVFVQEALDFLKEKAILLDAVAVSSGPGSYTGLRIGVSEAKGLCYGLEIPMIAVDTLKVMAMTVLAKELIGAGDLLCPMIDARRMEVYAEIYDSQLQVVRPVSADVVDENSYNELLSKRKVWFFGNGASKSQKSLTNGNAVFLTGIFPSAAEMAKLAVEAYNNKAFVDSAYYEPFYLKEFVATIPKNKVFS
jgi:tRNA threonylcarbamoyladenosine biosynthesis protein TsaB